MPIRNKITNTVRYGYQYVLIDADSSLQVHYICDKFRQILAQEKKPRTNKNDDSNTAIFTSDNRVDSKIDSPHLCRLIGDGLGLCVDYRDVLGGDFTAKGVGDIRNSNSFCLHHGRL